MAGRGFGFTSMGTVSPVDRYSKFAGESLENAVRASNSSRKQLKEDFQKFAPEASAAYFVDIEVEEEDDY